MTRVLMSIALAVVLSSAGRAEEVPADVAAAMTRAKTVCDGKFTTGKGFITRPDINGDNEPDVVVRFEHANCDGTPGVFCGTGGCVTQVFASLGDGKYALVMDQTAFRVKFARRHGLPAMIQHLHGSHCGRAGGEGPCEAVTYWNGAAFTPAYPLR